MTITINGTVSGTSGTVIVNTANVSSSITDTDPSNDMSSAETIISERSIIVTPIPLVALTIEKTVDRSVAAPLENLTYTITYANNSAYTAYNVFIADMLPVGTTIISAP